MRFFVGVVFCLLAGVGAMSTNAAARQEPSAAPGKVTIVTVFDNYRVNPELSTAWGFAAVISTPRTTVLFDTGGDGAMLLSNMRALGISPEDIDEVVISHVHADHLGGLSAFLAVNPHVTVWIPSSLPESVRREIVKAGARFQDVAGPTRIVDGVHTTGEMGGALKEQSLIVDTAGGIVVITGCAHSGIVSVVTAAKDLFRDRRIALVMGGFHLLSASNGEVDATIQAFRDMGVEKVAPSHCSGDRTRGRFQVHYAVNYVEGGAGRVVVFP